MGYVVAIGSVCIDEYFSCPKWPVIGDKSIVKPMDVKIGGMIANAASILGSYGAHVYLVDQIFKEDKELIFNELDEYNVDTSMISRSDNKITPKAYIMLTEKERTIFVSVNKPKMTLTSEQIEFIQNADYIYSSISELKNLKDNKEFLDGLSLDTKLVLDVESSTFDSFETDQYYFDKADILILNEFALKKLSGEEDEDAFLTRFMLLCPKEDRIIIITRGENGCEAYTEKDYYEVEGIKANVVDTTGAGDMFNATFIYCCIQKENIGTCLQVANYAASKSVEKLGPKSISVTCDDLERLIKHYRNKNVKVDFFNN